MSPVLGLIADGQQQLPLRRELSDGVKGRVRMTRNLAGEGAIVAPLEPRGPSFVPWLFARCRAVCHHGGAGTTAAGLLAGLPTVVVPSFGDQFFWGQMVANAGAGPEPIPMTRLDSAALAEALAMCRRPQMREHARALGARLRETDGVELVVQSVYRQLPGNALRCANDSDHLATVFCDTCGDRLCRDCGTAHSGHLVHPYRYVDWSARPARGVVGELGELMGDAAKALQAGLEEFIPRIGPRSSAF